MVKTVSEQKEQWQKLVNEAKKDPELSELYKTFDPWVMIPVKENWHPPFRLQYQGEVRLVMVQLHESCLQYAEPFIRVSVWGADDIYLERNWLPDKTDEARAMYVEVITQRYPTAKWLREHGFDGCM
jgi:hypothetical protein